MKISYRNKDNPKTWAVPLHPWDIVTKNRKSIRECSNELAKLNLKIDDSFKDDEYKGYKETKWPLKCPDCDNIYNKTITSLQITNNVMAKKDPNYISKCDACLSLKNNNAQKLKDFNEMRELFINNGYPEAGYELDETFTINDFEKAIVGIRIIHLNCRFSDTDENKYMIS